MKKGLLFILLTILSIASQAQTIGTATLQAQGAFTLTDGQVLTLAAQIVGCNSNAPIYQSAPISNTPNQTNNNGFIADSTQFVNVVLPGNDAVLCGGQNYTLYAITWKVNGYPVSPTRTYRILENTVNNLNQMTPVGFVPPIISNAVNAKCAAGQALTGYDSSFNAQCVSVTGFNPRGLWSSTTSYQKNDMVYYGSAAYVSVIATNLNLEPDQNPSAWSPIVLANAAGATGAIQYKNSAGTFSGVTGTAGNAAVWNATTGIADGGDAPAFRRAAQTPPLAYSPLNYASWTHAIHFGTSITYGNDSTQCTGTTGDTCDTSLVDVALGIPLANKLNYGMPGALQCDITAKVFNEYSPTNASGADTFVTMESGDNENQAERANLSSYAPLYEQCVQSAVTWLDTPLENKVLGSAVTSLPSGWSYDNTYSTVEGVSSTTNGATITFPAISLNPYDAVVIWYDQIQGNGGTATYQIKDASSGTVYRAGNITFAPAVSFSGNYSTTHAPGVVIIPSFITSAPTSVTLTVTVSSATSSSNIVRVLGYSQSLDAVYQNYANPTPTVWVADAHMLANDLFGQSTASFQQYMRTALWNLKQNGFPFTFDEMQNALSGQVSDYGTTTSCPTGVTSPCVDYPHPNNAGHAKRASIWLGPGSFVLSPQTPALTTLNLNTNGCAFTDGQTLNCNVPPYYETPAIPAPSSAYTLTCGNSFWILSNSGSGSATATLQACTQSYALTIYNLSTAISLTIAGASGTSLSSLGQWNPLPPGCALSLISRNGTAYYFNGASCTTASVAPTIPPIRAGGWTIAASATSVAVTFSTPFSSTPTACFVQDGASASATGSPFPTNISTTGLTVNVPTASVSAFQGTYACFVDNSN